MSAAPPAAVDFLVAAEESLALIGRVTVVQQWDEPSALPAMSVGALAAHLGAAVQTVHAAVTAGTAVTAERPVSLFDHYDRLTWVRGDLDDEANVKIREGAAQAAQVGHDKLLMSLESAMADLRVAFSADLPLPPAIRMPWWDWAISFDDFLLTRVMEMVVHTDDLAVSVGSTPPVLPEPVLGPVLALLVGVALRRHGQSAVVRALTRSERAGSIAAF